MPRTDSSHGFTAVRTEGAILPPSFLLDSVSTLKAKNQSGPDYGLSKSLSLRDEIARYWSIARDQFEEYEERRGRITKSGRTMVDRDWPIPLIKSVLGYEDLERTDPVQTEDRYFPLTHRACERTVPMLLTKSKYELDKADARFGYEGRRQAPHSLMQEYLNAEDSCLWGVVSNGSGLRLLRDNVNLTRPAFIEADLETMFREELYSDFAAFWLTAHESRLRPPDGSPSGCILERWRQQAHKEGERALDRMREGVTEALRRFGNGFLQHAKNERLRGRLESGDLTPEAYYEQLLRLVYRLLFLFTTEERDLLHVPEASGEMRRIYSEGYSVSRLRDRALMGRHYDHHEDLWSSLRILFQSLQRGEPRIGLPGLGGLFAGGHCPDLDAAAIANRDLLEAVRHLGYFRYKHVLTRVNYRDMDAEELGSVYESLLENHPVIDVESMPMAFELADKGLERRLTGSYYTPAVLVSELMTSALDPVLRQAVQDRSRDARSAILSLKVIDPACGSGHFLLAAARRMAANLARIVAGGDSPDEPLRRRALREVVQNCIYGVDRNPLAVELCRTALWIEAVEPGKPLTFLDPHIQLGDSLIGIVDPTVMNDGIPSEAYKPHTGDNLETCTLLRDRNKQRDAALQANLFDESGFADIADFQSQVDALPENTIEEIELKRASWGHSNREPTRMKNELLSDVFTAAFVSKKSKDNAGVAPLQEDLNRITFELVMRDGVVEHVERTAIDYQFFHWHTSFAEVMRAGGFDVVVGNPPWKRIKLQEKEFFMMRSPDIANARNKATRDRLIHELNGVDSSPAEKRLYREFIDAKGRSEALSSFMRHSNRYPLTGHGDINRYALFAETALRLLNPRGRAGIIVPTGIATDSATQRYFRALIDELHLISLIDFENREGLFPGVGRAQKFCLLTIGSEFATPSYTFFCANIDDLRKQDINITFELSREDIRLLNPNTRTAPVFRTRKDAEITKKIYRRMALIKNRSSGDAHPWDVEFSRMFDMANDSNLFKTWEQLESMGAEKKGSDWIDEGGRIWSPLVEAKMFHHYDHRWRIYEPNGTDTRIVTSQEKRNSDFNSVPRYWVMREEIDRKLAKGKERKGKERKGKERKGKHSSIVPHSNGVPPSSPPHCQIDGSENDSCISNPRLGVGTQGGHRLNPEWWIAFRKTARSTDVRTSIMTLLPRSGMSDRAPIVRPSSAESGVLMVSVFNSFVFDYCTRNAISGTDLSFFIIEQLPVPTPAQFMQQIGSEVTYKEFIIPRVLELTYTSSALQPFAHELGYDGPPFLWCDERRFLIKCELDAAMFHLYGLDMEDLTHIMDAFPIVKRKDCEQYGEYRTKHMIQELFTLIGEAIASRRPYKTVLSPRPGTIVRR